MSHWPWNEEKSLIGSVAFFISAAIAMWVLVSLSVAPGDKFAWLLVVAPVLVGCLVESLPITIIKDRKPDDNLILILSCGLTIQIVQNMLGMEGLFPTN